MYLFFAEQNYVLPQLNGSFLLHVSVNIFAIVYFNARHDTWLNLSNITDLAAVETFKLPITQSLTQIVDIPTRFSRKS